MRISRCTLLCIQTQRIDTKLHSGCFADQHRPCRLQGCHHWRILCDRPSLCHLHDAKRHCHATSLHMMRMSRVVHPGKPTSLAFVQAYSCRSSVAGCDRASLSEPCCIFWHWLECCCRMAAWPRSCMTGSDRAGTATKPAAGSRLTYAQPEVVSYGSASIKSLTGNGTPSRIDLGFICWYLHGCACKGKLMRKHASLCTV